MGPTFFVPRRLGHGVGWFHREQPTARVLSTAPLLLFLCIASPRDLFEWFKRRCKRPPCVGWVFVTEIQAATFVWVEAPHLRNLSGSGLGEQKLAYTLPQLSQVGGHIFYRKASTRLGLRQKKMARPPHV